jgi:ferredoxin
MMGAKMSTILFEPLDLRVDCKEGENAYAAARRQNVPIPSACFGRGNCGLCRVRVVSGEAALSPINAVEKKHLGNSYFVTKLRLACQLQISDDVILAIPDAGRLQKAKPLPQGPLLTKKPPPR